MIDIHSHILTVWDRKPFTEKDLLERMDKLGIEKSVLLPLGESPETNFFYFGTKDAIAVYLRHPDRIIPFCCVDPRAGGNSPSTDFSWILCRYKEAGCRGFGEFIPNLYIDDPLCMNLFRQCGRAGLPVLFHLYREIGGFYGLVDSPGLPRLERVLKECPETVFIGHAMAFWDEVSGYIDLERRHVYPVGSIKSPGRMQVLMKKYSNLYGDLSAGSGLNAITRDRDYGYKFIEEFQDRLLFGTDLCHQEPEIPGAIIGYFRDALDTGMISKAVYDKITEDNAKRILNLN
ncbi:MAG TPA: amidohydrolase family protein [bacterium]|nr:amidohydrolase family protein [bacterium]